MTFKKINGALAVCATASLFGASESSANTFPQHSIDLVTPFPAGGATDALARILADSMSRTLNQPVVVMNKPGGGTTIGVAYAARQKPDGYSILLASNSGLVTSRFLFKQLQYDPDAFEPIGMAGYGPSILIGSKKQSFENPAAVVEYARAKPGNLTIANHGTGTTAHLIAECFKEQAGIEAIDVPFKGSAEAMPMVINGDIDILFEMAGPGMVQGKSGAVDVLAVTSPQRVKWISDVPTLTEMGYPGCDIYAWWALVAPHGTPETSLAPLRRALQAALQDEGVSHKLINMGIDPADGSAATVSDQVRSEIPRYEKLVKRANIPMH